MPDSFEWITFVVSTLAGAVAGVAGFGIGSLLTPLFVPAFGTKIAVAIVAIPHFCGTALRLFLLRKHVDRKILREFGITSAIGGLCGALLHAFASSPILTVVLATLLVFAGISGLTGLAARFRLRGRTAAVAGGLSGVLGGLVGNQGGIRSAAMLGTGATASTFVATATAIGLVVDLARLPVYLSAEWSALRPHGTLIALAVAGVIAGTLGGGRILRKIPERMFRRIVAALILLLGIYLFTTL